MASSTSAQDSALLRTEPPYQTYEFFRESRELWARWDRNTYKRLLWSLDGPLETAITVLDRPLRENPTTREPLFNTATGEYHPIAALPVSEPRVSSIIVRVHNLEEWEDMWEEMHWRHSEPDADFEGCEWGVLEEDGGNEGGGDEDESNLVPIRCCGMPRPRNKKASIEVRPAKTSGPDGGFVTVLDYVTAVHPWLVGLRSDILGELGTLAGLDDPLPDDTPLVVCPSQCDYLFIEPRDEPMGGRGAVLVDPFTAHGGQVE